MNINHSKAYEIDCVCISDGVVLFKADNSFLILQFIINILIGLTEKV
jgi:hypothetical protein